MCHSIGSYPIFFSPKNHQKFDVLDKMMRDVEQSLDRFGYDILEKKTDDRGFFQEIIAKKRNDNIFFNLERLQETHFGGYLCRVKMVGESSISVKFSIEKKISNTQTAVKKSGILDDYLITAANQGDIIEFITHERIFPIFQDLVDIAMDNKVEVNSANGKFLIRLKSDCDFTKSLRSIPTMESITWIFETADTFEKLISGIGRYECSKCSTVIDLADTICPNCGNKTPHCIICMRDPSVDEKIMQLSCCSSYVHQQELYIWLEIKTTCPYCRTINPDVKSVELY